MIYRKFFCIIYRNSKVFFRNIAIWGIIFLQVIDPELANTLSDLIIENTVSTMESYGVGGEVVDTTIASLEEEIPNSFTPLGQAKSFGWQFLTSAVGCAIIAIFVKKNEEVSDRLN